MAVALEFINFLVPIQTIRDKHSGGLEQCLKDYEGMIGGKVWFDEHLFRDGAMNSMAMDRIVEWWERHGLQGQVLVDGEPRWKDFCISDSLFGPTLPCDWVEFGDRCAYLKGTEEGEIVGPTY